MERKLPEEIEKVIEEDEISRMKHLLILVSFFTALSCFGQSKHEIHLTDLRTMLHQFLEHDEIKGEVYHSSLDEMKRDTTYHINHFRIYNPAFNDELYGEGVYILAYDDEHVYMDTNRVLIRESFKDLFHENIISEMDTHQVILAFDSLLMGHIKETWFEFKVNTKDPHHSFKGFHLATAHFCTIDITDANQKLVLEYDNEDKTILFNFAYEGDNWHIDSYEIHEFDGDFDIKF